MEEQVTWQRKFYTITVGQAISLIGSSAVQFALVWWLTIETGSAIVLSLATLLIYLPYVVLGPFAGVWVDRLKRKPVIIFADLFTAFVALVFSVAFFFGKPPYWAVFIALGVRSIAGVFHTPAIQAIIPMLVPQEQIMKANSIKQFLQTGSLFLGPVMGASMFAVWPMGFILLTDVAGALIACSAVAIIKIPELLQEQKETSHFFSEVKEGIAEYLKNKRLFYVTLVTIICFLFILPEEALYPLVVSNIFNGTEWHVSAVNVTFCLGMMVGAAGIGRFSKRIKNKLSMSMIGLLVLAVVSLLWGILPHNTVGFLLFIVLCFFVGVGININSIPYVSYLQENIPPQKQGRVLSLYGSITSISLPFGLIIAGPVAEIFGVMFYFIFAGIVSIIVIFVYIIFTLMLKSKSKQMRF
jgi:DHA3 family macrolide efflux protein-like MFS transporter